MSDMEAFQMWRFHHRENSKIVTVAVVGYSDDITHNIQRGRDTGKEEIGGGVKTVGSATPPNANVSFCKGRNGSPIGNYWQFPYKRHRLGFALRHNGQLPRTTVARANAHKRILKRTDPKLNEFGLLLSIYEAADCRPFLTISLLWGTEELRK